MNWDIASILSIDGLASGSIYLLAGMGLVLVFCVTRVVFLPFGDIVAFAALTMAAFEARKLPPTLWLVLVLAAFAACVEVCALIKQGKHSKVPKALCVWILLPAIPCVTTWLVANQELPAIVSAILSVALVMPIIPLVARVALQPIASASILSLFMVSLALHFMLTGVGLLFFGPDGARTAPLITGSINLVGYSISAQIALTIGVSLAMCLIFYLLFEYTLSGKAMRATAVNRVGARLVGIRPSRTSMLTYSAASLLAGVIGVLIAPNVTMYYSSGFLIGLKAFVAATIGGLVSYPLTALGALAVGMAESFSSFWAGSLKDVIVFSLLIPVLIVRSLLTGNHMDNEAEELD